MESLPSQRRPSRALATLPTCANCRIPINLCHCSKSTCSACTLAAAECACARTPRGAPTTCAWCSELEKQLREAAEKAGALEQELLSARHATAELRQQAQAEREARARVAVKLEQAKAQLAAASKSHARQGEAEAELARLRERLQGVDEDRAGMEASRRAAMLQASKLKEEVAVLRHRLQDSERTARLAEEGRLEYVAHIADVETQMEKLRRELIQARTERDEQAALAEEATRLRERLCAEEQARAALEEKLKLVKSEQVVIEREHDKYIELRQANRKLEALLAEAQDRCRRLEPRVEMVETLEERITALTQQNDSLLAEVEHVKHLRQLFASVTSKTDEVQQAAKDVIQQVEAQKRERAARVSGFESAVALSELKKPPNPPVNPRAPGGKRTPRAAAGIGAR